MVMPASRRSLLALAFVAGLVLLGLFSLSRTTGAAGLPPGGDFTLQSADGPLALHDLRGRVVLLFFGYTACPGICPTALMDEAAAFQLLRRAGAIIDGKAALLGMELGDGDVLLAGIDTGDREAEARQAAALMAHAQ